MAIGIFLTVVAIGGTMRINDATTTAFNEIRTDEIRQKCYDNLVDIMGGSQYVTESSVNICVGTVLNALNK